MAYAQEVRRVFEETIARLRDEGMDETILLALERMLEACEMDDIGQLEAALADVVFGEPEA